MGNSISVPNHKPLEIDMILKAEKEAKRTKVRQLPRPRPRPRRQSVFDLNEFFGF